jgi:ABC-type glycerol-3-phosphate transport system permease component
VRTSATRAPIVTARFPWGIALFGGQFTTPYGTIFAASAVAMLRIAILVLVFRRAVVSGLSERLNIRVRRSGTGIVAR